MGFTPTLRFSEPLDYREVELLDCDEDGDRIGYTDCMESSVLRFVQAMLADLNSLDHNGAPQRVDQALVRKRVRDPAVAAFLHEHGDILPRYDEGKAFLARQRWAGLCTRKPFFTYKRSTESNVYKNDAFEGFVEVSASVQWLLELEPCVHNIIEVLRHWLGCDFAELESTDGPPSPWANGGESHNIDVSGAAQGHVDAAMRSLSRPGMLLQAVLNPPSRSDDPSRFYVHLDIALNGRPAWRWVLTRQHLNVVPPYDAGCPRDERFPPTINKALFVTSAHSHIVAYDAAVHGSMAMGLSGCAAAPLAPGSSAASAPGTTAAPAEATGLAAAMADDDFGDVQASDTGGVGGGDDDEFCDFVSASRAD